MAAMFTAVSCGPKESQKRALVLYYSQTNNTKMVAEELAKRLDADIEEIVAVKPYDGDFMQTIERCMKEREEGVIPEIKSIKSDVSKYEVIFIGFPVWFGTYAPPVAKLLETYDLSGKKVVPFCTFGSGGLESSAKDMMKAQPNAKIMPGYGVRAARLDAMPAEIDQFLKENSYIAGEYVQLDEFSEFAEVTEEEASIFEKATGNYPMMNAKAVMVAKRGIPNGVEYVYIAEDMPSAGEMKVYVNLINNEAPVFTRVVR